jgi:hypothetical protein
MARNLKQTEREKIAKDRAAALEQGLSRLSVVVPATVATVPSVEIKRDGLPVGPAAWGTAIPVDPGEHVVEASAPGKRPWQEKVKVGPNGAKVSLEVPALEDLPKIASKTKPPETAPLAPAPEQPGPSPTGRGDTQRLVGLLTGVAGLAGIGVGVVYSLKESSKKSDRDSHCVQGQSDCDLLTSQTKDAANYANLSYVIGGIALVGGGVLYLTAPHDPKPATASGLDAHFGIGVGQIRVSGSF